MGDIQKLLVRLRMILLLSSLGMPLLERFRLRLRLSLASWTNNIMMITIPPVHP
jgi:hypothetical protein